MNIIVLDADEVRGDEVVLTGRRARHVATVLAAEPGSQLRVGILDGRVGTGRVLALEDDSVRLEVELCAEPPAPSNASVVLALPRPKILKRLLIDLTAIGVKDIHLVGAWKVDKSYWSSPALRDETLREHLVLGLEQGGDTVLPTVTCHRLFKPFVEDELPAIAAGKRRFVAHPRAQASCPRAITQPFVVAIGPERGFTDYEIDRFVEAEFQAVSLGPRPLRVESALAMLLGRLA